MNQKLKNTIDELKKKKRILFLTTSNRWSGQKEKPKSTLLAEHIKNKLGEKLKIIDVTSLKIYECEGNVSTKDGNICGVKKAELKDKEKNPTGYHRCWASINNKDDELWKVSKEIFDSDCVVFFSSVRWGQACVFYQKLIERLTWIENRHDSFGEDNILEGKDVGVILIGHNWNGENVLKTQKKVLDFFGFNVNDKLCWNWQYIQDYLDETPKGYLEDPKVFEETFLKD